MRVVLACIFAATFTTLLLAMPAIAQDAEKKNIWSGETALGYITTSGNTNNTNVNFKQTVIYDSKPLVNTLVISGSNTTSEVTAADGSKEKSRTAEQYFASNKLDYLFTERTYGLFRVTWEKDRFNGFDHQSTGVVGMGHQMIKTDSVGLKFELGIGQRDDEADEVATDDDKANSELIGYFANEFVWKISDPAEFGQTLTVEYGENNTVSRFTVYIKSQLMTNVSIKVSHDIKRNSDVPEGTNHSDRAFIIAAVYTF